MGTTVSRKRRLYYRQLARRRLELSSHGSGISARHCGGNRTNSIFHETPSRCLRPYRRPRRLPWNTRREPRRQGAQDARPRSLILHSGPHTCRSAKDDLGCEQPFAEARPPLHPLGSSSSRLALWKFHSSRSRSANNSNAFPPKAD